MKPESSFPVNLNEYYHKSENTIVSEEKVWKPFVTCTSMYNDMVAVHACTLSGHILGWPPPFGGQGDQYYVSRYI